MKAIVAVLVVACLLPASIPQGAPVAPAGPSDPASVVGGAWYACPLLGVVFGLEVATGNVVGAFGALVGAINYGCL